MSANLRNAQARHDFANFFGEEEEVVDDVLRLARELGAQGRVLGGDPDRASIQMTLAHHDAAQRDERRGGEAELFGAEQRRNGDIAAGLQLAVGLNDDAAAQVIHDENLLRFGKTEFPRNARVLERSERRRASAAVVAADEDDVRMRFGNAGRDGSDTHFGDELDGDARFRIDVLQIVDQLRKIFDRVNVVVRRRRDQADTRNRVACPCDVLIHFMAGKLTAFARLCALRDLDLQLVGIHKIVCRDAESAGGDLLDRTAPIRL